MFPVEYMRDLAQNELGILQVLFQECGRKIIAVENTRQFSTNPHAQVVRIKLENSQSLMSFQHWIKQKDGAQKIVEALPCAARPLSIVYDGLGSRLAAPTVLFPVYTRTTIKKKLDLGS